MGDTPKDANAHGCALAGLSAEEAAGRRAEAAALKSKGEAAAQGTKGSTEEFKAKFEAASRSRTKSKQARHCRKRLEGALRPLRCVPVGSYRRARSYA